MTSYVWRLPKTAPIRSEGALTYQLLVPKGSYRANSKRLLNSTIWLVSESDKASLLYAKLKILSVETIKTGPLAGFLILEADIDRSFYLAPRTSDKSNLWVMKPASLSGLPMHILFEADRALSKMLADFVASAIERRFSPPPQLFLQEKEIDLKVDSPHTLVQSTVRSLKRHYAVGDLPFYARHTSSWTVYESVTYFILKKAGLAQKELIEALDWYVDSRSKPDEARVPHVDTILRGVDPENIVPREFTATLKTVSQEALVSQLAKLDYAEKRHQAILRDLVCHCLKMGVTPLSSRSIDLALCYRDGRFYIFEVKSAIKQNFFDQAVRAVAQLFQYKYEIERGGARVAGVSLVIDSCDDDELRTYTRQFLESLDIGMLLYSDDVPWPHRLPQLERFLNQAR